jgi:tRNA pseudouridine55 synthase
VAPALVTLHAVEWRGRVEDRIRIRLEVGAGFYVRALARDLGISLGCGGHLTALRRTASGSFSVEHAVSLEAAERLGPDLPGRLIDPLDAIPEIPRVRLTDTGLRRVAHGNPVGPADVLETADKQADIVKIAGADSRLLALARWRSGTLHPFVVLG